MPKKIARIMVSILTYVYVLTIVPLAVSGFFGIHCFAVISASMSPEIPTASLVLSKETDFDKLEVNDVITYLISEDQTVTRRIISIDKNRRLQPKEMPMIRQTANRFLMRTWLEKSFSMPRTSDTYLL